MKRTLTLVLTAMVLFTACTQPPPSTPEPTQPSTSQTTSISQTSTSQPETKTLSMEEYLKDNAISATEENMVEMFKLIDTEQYDVFLSGETHSMKNVYKFKFELLKYLNETAGVRFHLKEMGFASGQLYNLYLKTGDEKYIDYRFFSVEDEEFLKKIYEYNQTIPENRRIQIIGIDTEDAPYALKYLNFFLPDSNPADFGFPSEVSELLVLLKNTEKMTKQIAEGFINVLFSSIDQHQEQYQKYLGNKYKEFIFIIEGLEVDYRHATQKDVNEQAKYRENHIKERFKVMYQSLKGEKFHGHYGSAHISQIPLPGTSPYTENTFVARAIDEGVISKDKICSIVPFYINCENLRLKEGAEKKYVVTPVTSGAYSLITKNKEILDTITTDYGFIRLNGENSPFSQGQDLMLYSFEGVTTDVYQYAYVLKNSPPVTQNPPKK